MLYPVAIDKQDDGFVAEVPDLPELSITGESVADVIRNARLAISEQLQAIVDQGRPLPNVRDLSTHLDNADFFGRIWAIVSLESAYFIPKTTNVALHLPQKMLTAIYDQTQSDDPQALQAFILDAINLRLGVL